MINISILDSLIEKTKRYCVQRIRRDKQDLFYVDAIDGEEISAHYGATHAAAAFILMGMDIGYDLLESVLNRWEQSKKLPGFHNDFNSFALCIIWDAIEGKGRYADWTKETILKTEDSKHNTVNWLPMRWYVNKKRYEWTGNDNYQAITQKCKRDITEATYEDGFIDDRLPKGMSFNLQYDVTTVALLQYLRTHG